LKTILVIGIKGMAGHVIFRYLQNNNNYTVFGLARNIEPSKTIFNLDISDTNELRNIIINYNFNIIINCIGVLNNAAECNPSNAVWFNSFFPHLLVEITKNTNSRVIQISTDCVFNGKKGNYKESDVRDGEGFYAQSKALGEINNSKDLTIRTSIIGPELNINGIGLFNWFMHQSGEINGFTNAIWSGVTTLELANAIDYTILHPISGLVHLTNGLPVSKFDLLHIIKEVWDKKDIIIKPYEGKVVDKSLKKSKRFNYKVPSYKEMLVDQHIWMHEFANLYQY
jgi:dTDP-4-dehydrorhamnose reductase